MLPVSLTDPIGTLTVERSTAGDFMELLDRMDEAERAGHQAVMLMLIDMIHEIFDAEA